MKFLSTLLAVALAVGCIFPPNAEAFGNRGRNRQSAFERGFNAGQRNNQRNNDFARGFRAGQRSARGVRGCH